tara:strand:- start:876 stop:1163 length:288 start_codon:yes stop_codon:yes gene_type:complete
MSKEDGDLYDIYELELMEDCLRNICDEARGMNEQEYEMAVLFDNPQIARYTEQLIGVATEEKVLIPEKISKSQEHYNDELTNSVKDFVEDVKKTF